MRSKGNLATSFAAAGVMLLAFGAALTASCRGADQIAPTGSTIVLAANPATILVINGSGTSDIVATVSSAAGVPLKDQDVRFSSTAGSLTDANGNPAANIPIRSDDLGNAHVTLVTATQTTVTARSGAATGSLSLSAVNGNLNAIQVNQDTESTGCLDISDITNCSDTICLIIQAVDDEGSGLVGVPVVVKLQNTTPDFGVTFSGGTQLTTGSGGIVRSSFKLNSTDCGSTCKNPDSCEADIVVSLQNGDFPSSPLHFTASIN